MIKLTLIRHGQSIANVNRSIYNEMVDWEIPLTELGISQSNGVVLDIQNPSKTLMLTSNYKRAIDTGSIIHNSNNLEITLRQDPLIHEILLCTSDESLLDIRDNYDNMYKNRLRYFKRPNQGESYLDCYMRARLFLNSILSGFYGKDLEEIIIVSHGCFIQMLLANIDNLSIEEVLEKEIENCEIIVRILG